MKITAMLHRLNHLMVRRRNARRLGVPFARASSFELPGQVLIAGRPVRLSIPREPYQKVAFVELLLDDCYDLHAIARESQVRTVLDIGANVGLFGLAARAAFPDATIHAYEPNRALEADLAQNANQAEVRYFLEAVGAAEGTVDLAVDPNQSVLSRTRMGGSIRQVSLATAIERLGGWVDVLKMDCEGAEWDILRGDGWTRVGHVTMEYHLDSDRSHDVITSALAALGFKIMWQRRLNGFGLVRAKRPT
jgi:FkbM family methyltransferase